MDIKQIASLHGYMSVSIGLAIALLLWFLLIRRWKPRTKLVYGVRFSMWPVVFMSFSLGGPISREIFGLKSRYLGGIGETLLAITGLLIIVMPIFFVIGYLIAKRVFPIESMGNLRGDGQ